MSENAVDQSLRALYDRLSDVLQDEADLFIERIGSDRWCWFTPAETRTIEQALLFARHAQDNFGTGWHIEGPLIGLENLIGELNQFHADREDDEI